jgi:hypothetical protein
MNRLRQFWIVGIALAILCASILSLAPSTQAATTPQTAPPVSTLVAIRAAAHRQASPRYERVVFEFRGPVPLISVQYTNQLIGDGSGLPVAISGRAIVLLTMKPAQAHNDQGQTTAPTRVKYNLANIKEVASAGDFEAVLNYGIGLDHKTELRVLTLDNPSRVVVDFIER